MTETGATPSRAAAEASYAYGIPALLGVAIVATLVFALLLRMLTLAVRELAAASRVMGAAVGLVGAAKGEETARAEERHRELRADLADVKATVERAL